VRDSAYLRYNQLDISAYHMLQLSYRSDAKAIVELRKDHRQGPLLGSTRLPAAQETGAFTMALNAPAGRHDLFFVFYLPGEAKLSLEKFTFGTEHERSPALVALQDSIRSIAPVYMPIMRELPEDRRRASFVFERGNWLVHGSEVQAGVPGSLNTFEGYPANRLGLALWLLSEDNPLTARVTVNRFWEQLFGYGLVRTPEDFGTQGEAPTHPELLDWLALRFVREYDWSMKRLIKEIVMSGTYRQSSVVSEELYRADPQNRWLARGPRYRLSAEQVRDQALAVSGLLSDKMYGPPVMPEQPEGIWNTIRHVMRWRTSEGEDRYRRAVYTYLRRSSPYPSLITFDSPSRNFCVSRRIRTNTPLQALTTLNDPVYFEAARALAARSADVSDADSRLAGIYKFALGRKPAPAKQQRLLAYYRQTEAAYRNKEVAEIERLTGTMLEATPENAALVMASNVVMNLDEFLTKE
jgi:hypothetical protein